jgi:hypothetical protein
MPGVISELTKPATRYRYGVYGISLRSEIPLSLAEPEDSNLPEIELRTGPPSLFSKAVEGATLLPTATAWYRHAHLRDGSTYLRWEGLSEFLVSADGLRITFGWIGPASWEAFQVYLLGQALSFALVKRGYEPLHATSVVAEGRAVVFLGDSGFGKSSLAACFLRAGHQLLTDDLLLLREGPGGFRAYPGPPRIKLLPDMAGRFLGKGVTGPPMNLDTEKRVIALAPHQRCVTPVPLGAIYALGSPREVARKQRVRIERLSSRQAFVTLVASTFNRTIVGADRLQRQFHATARLAAVVPVKKLVYPRRLESLPLVRELVLADLSREGFEVSPCGD